MSARITLLANSSIILIDNDFYRVFNLEKKYR